VESRGLERLPRAYQIGLRLRALGADDELIAQCLDMSVEGVGTLLAIGERKLRNAESTVFEAPDQGPEEIDQH
jgi:hypothetical protein